MCIKATVFCVILFSFLVIEVKCSKILGFFHFPSVSHHLVYQQVYKELSLRGHDVVVVTPNPLNDPTLTNLTEIDISYIYKEKPNGGITLDYQGFYMDFYYEYGYKVAEMVLQDPRVTSLCSSDSTTFDVALVESYYPIWYKFGARCKAQLIAFSSADSMMSVHNALGNPLHPAYFGGFMLDYTNPLSIWKKIEYTYYFVWYNWFHQKYVLASSDYLIDKYINESLPKTEELEKNVSLLLVNTNLVICPIQPLVPSTIMLGFMHIKKSTSPSQIPKYPSTSGQFVYKALVKELSLRGHQVVSAISTKPLDDPKLNNLTEILMSYPILKDEEKAINSGFSYTKFFRYVFGTGLRNAEVFLQDKRIQNLCKNDTFDVVIVEGYFSIWYAFEEKFKAPTIGITSIDGLLSSHNSRGNPIHPALYVEFLPHHIDPSSIWKKIEHLYYILWNKWFTKYIYMYNSDRIIKKYMGDGYLKTKNMEKNPVCCSLTQTY